MSKFLGKIHYWLFNKIKNSEEVEAKVYAWALKQPELKAAEWMEQINNEFGEAVGTEELSEIIELTNIHGWLQSKIIAAEARQAKLITNILAENNEYITELDKIFIKDGAEKGELAKYAYEINEPKDLYAALNDYILEGMPCDNVDKKVESTDKQFQWISTRCLHQSNWDKAGGDINIYYQLREKWINSFVGTIDAKFGYKSEKEGEFRINTILVQ